jgi:hypothetical protein
LSLKEKTVDVFQHQRFKGKKMVGDARKIEIILLPSKWQMFFKFDGKFDFKEIFPQILRQAEILGRLFVFLKSVTL